MSTGRSQISYIWRDGGDIIDGRLAPLRLKGGQLLSELRKYSKGDMILLSEKPVQAFGSANPPLHFNPPRLRNVLENQFPKRETVEG